MALLTKLIGTSCVVCGLWLAGDSLNINYNYRDYSLVIKPVSVATSKDYYQFVGGSLIFLTGSIILGRDLSSEATKR